MPQVGGSDLVPSPARTADGRPLTSPTPATAAARQPTPATAPRAHKRRQCLRASGITQPGGTTACPDLTPRLGAISVRVQGLRGARASWRGALMITSSAVAVATGVLAAVIPAQAQA